MDKGTSNSLDRSSNICLFIHLEMEEHTKEVEHDLRQNIDLLQSRIHEVESSPSKNPLSVLFFSFRKNVKSNSFNTPLVITNVPF